MRSQFAILYLTLIIAACLAEVPSSRLQRRHRPSINRFQRLRSQPLRARYFARQQLAATPYPAAEDIKPAAGGQPELEYGPPEQTYGPPQQPTLLVGEQLPAAGTAQEFAPNPDAEEFAPTTSVRLTAIQRQQLQQQLQHQQQQLQQQRLQRPVRPIKLQAIQSQQQLVQSVQPIQVSQSIVKSTPPVFSAALTVPPLTTQPATLPLNAIAQAPLALPAQQYFVLNQPFAYTTQYQAW